MVYIVIPVHNRIEATRKCLQSLVKQSVSNTFTLLIDDGSTDGTSAMVSAEFPTVKIFQGNGDLWWTGAVNLAILYVLQSAGNADFVLTMNNDTMVRSNYIEELLTVYGSHPGSLVGSVSVDSTKEESIIDSGTKISWVTGKYSKVSKAANYTEFCTKYPSTIDVDVLSGRGTLIPVSVFREIGLYDWQSLPHYGADFEFSIRAMRKGHKLIVATKALVISDWRTTGVKNEYSPIAWNDLLNSFRSIRSPNNLKYRWNFARKACPPLLLPTFFLMDTLRVLGGALRNQMRRFRQ